MAPWSHQNRSAAACVLLAASLVAVVIVEQFRIEHLRETVAVESVRAAWEAARSVYKLDGSDRSAMIRIIEDLHCIFVLADDKGAPLQYSGIYRDIGAPLAPNTSPENGSMEVHRGSKSAHAIATSSESLRIL